MRQSLSGIAPKTGFAEKLLLPFVCSARTRRGDGLFEIRKAHPHPPFYACLISICLLLAYPKTA